VVDGIVGPRADLSTLGCFLGLNTHFAFLICVVYARYCICNFVLCIVLCDVCFFLCYCITTVTGCNTICS
jgi:hypothetical protein